MPWVDQFLQDLRFGARSLTRTLGLTVVAVISLGLGIGAATAMYSVMMRPQIAQGTAR